MAIAKFGPISAWINWRDTISFCFADLTASFASWLRHLKISNLIWDRLELKYIKNTSNVLGSKQRVIAIVLIGINLNHRSYVFHAKCGKRVLIH